MSYHFIRYSTHRLIECVWIKLYEEDYDCSSFLRWLLCWEHRRSADISGARRPSLQVRRDLNRDLSSCLYHGHVVYISITKILEQEEAGHQK